MPKLVLALVVVLVALALPTAAFGAGVVNTTAAGHITYLGDAAANIVDVSTSPTGPGNVIFEETGISEGTDNADICSDAGNSVMCNFDTSDALEAQGGSGADEITAGGPLPLTLLGGANDDKLIGGAGADVLAGDVGADDLFGNAGADTSSADEGDGDLIDLGPGRDNYFLATNNGTGDTLRGGSGVDTLVYLPLLGTPAPKLRFDLQNGTFSFSASAPYPAGAGAITGIEDLGAYAGVPSDDVLIGSASSNLLAGGDGDDQIIGGAGTDTLLGDHGLLPLGALAGVVEGDPADAGSDTITARDGFSDRVDCGPAADTAVIDQFDGPDTENCESAPVASVFPFGIAPPVAPDTTAPTCKRSKLARKKRKTFLSKGFSFRFNCNEQARVEVFAAVTPKRRKGGKVVFSKAGDVLLAHKVFGFKAGSRTLKFKAAKSVRKSLAKRFKVRLRIDATDRAGNRRTTSASLSVR